MLIKKIVSFMYVHRCGHAEVAKALVLELQADISVKDNAGSTPLHIAAKNGCADVVSFLLTQPGIDPVSNQLKLLYCSDIVPVWPWGYMTPGMVLSPMIFIFYA